MHQLNISTSQQKEVVDISEKINNLLSEKKYIEGLCFLFAGHTTCSLTTADLDPGTDKDMLEALEKIVPKLKYRHPHNPQHVGDHIISSMIGPSLVVPVKSAMLLLGHWQRVVLVELSGPRERDIYLTFISNN